MTEGTRVLITNPTLVETGLDLNYFTTLLFYNVSYNLMTLRQAAKRSWRINQTAPRIEVYFYFYIATMQDRAMHLMASKLAVAGVIEGNMTDEGLAAMSDCRDLTAQLAQELIRGIQNNCDIEDLSASFKKMAILKSGGEPEPTPIACLPIPGNAIPKVPAPDAPKPQSQHVQPEDTVLENLQPEEQVSFVFGAPVRRTKKKEAVEFEDQLSLWSPTERSA